MGKVISNVSELKYGNFYWAIHDETWQEYENVEEEIPEFFMTEFAFVLNELVFTFNTEEGYDEYGDIEKPMDFLRDYHIEEYNPNNEELREMRRHVFATIFNEADWLRKILK